jgi:hypothetical protein
MRPFSGFRQAAFLFRGFISGASREHLTGAAFVFWLLLLDVPHSRSITITCHLPSPSWASKKKEKNQAKNDRPDLLFF